MVTQEEKTVLVSQASTLGERMQSAGPGKAVIPTVPESYGFDFVEEEVEAPGEVLPGEGLRLSNIADAMPELIVALRKWRGMTQAQLGEAIGYPAPVVGNIEQGRRRLGLKTLGDIFDALGGELYIEFREKK
ncbi:MAG: XRE family transcriptional regulator [Cytophagales bacterium]|nr:MAG: XRE family transcriptional regulator [Cytophagales bacterium]